MLAKKYKGLTFLREVRKASLRFGEDNQSSSFGNMCPFGKWKLLRFILLYFLKIAGEEQRILVKFMSHPQDNLRDYWHFWGAAKLNFSQFTEPLQKSRSSPSKGNNDSLLLLTSCLQNGFWKTRAGKEAVWDKMMVLRKKGGDAMISHWKWNLLIFRNLQLFKTSLDCRDESLIEAKVLQCWCDLPTIQHFILEPKKNDHVIMSSRATEWFWFLNFQSVPDL